MLQIEAFPQDFEQLCHVLMDRSECTRFSNCQWNTGWLPGWLPGGKCVHAVEIHNQYKWKKVGVLQVLKAVDKNIANNTLDHFTPQLVVLQAFVVYLHTLAATYMATHNSTTTRLNDVTASEEELRNNTALYGEEAPRKSTKELAGEIKREKNKCNNQLLALKKAQQNLWQTWRGMLQTTPLSKWLLEGLEAVYDLPDKQKAVLRKTSFSKTHLHTFVEQMLNTVEAVTKLDNKIPPSGRKGRPKKYFVR